MSTRSLEAAGITDPELQDSYERCRLINSRHGKTYYLATLLLPPAKRPYVHALYGLARAADDIVDETGGTSIEAKRQALDDFTSDFFADLKLGRSRHPIFGAAVDTAVRWDIPSEHFEAFVDSMYLDLSVDHYDTFDDLLRYTYGSAAVIGLQMMPILEPTDQRAYGHAIELGVAFQLANFIRDIGEDLDRGRIYLPLEELEIYGVTPADLRQRVATPDIRAALAFQVQRVRDLAETSRPGIAMLSPACQPCIEAARVLYCGIADEVARRNYDVFSSRASVGLGRRLAVAGPAWAKSLNARRTGRGFALHA